MGSTKDKSPREKFNKKRMTKLLQEENDFVTNLLLICDVPYSNEIDENDQLYINQKGKKANRKPEKVNGTTGNGPAVKEEVDEDVRTEIMANKMKYKKNKLSERGLKKKEQKKAEKDKKMKKVLVTAGKALKNSLLKQEKADPDQKPDTKPGTKLPFKPVYNSDGKLVFSKFDFAAGTTSLVKNKKKGNKSAEVVLDELKKKDKEIKNLMQSGEKAKALEIKSDLAWRKAFDKVEGRKVKDDVELLKKTIHKKEVKKLKSKVNWDDRKKKVDQRQENRCKRRQDNINKKIDEKKKKKVKKLSKQGRVMPGF